jgi:hypothetical protein
MNIEGVYGRAAMEKGQVYGWHKSVWETPTRWFTFQQWSLHCDQAIYGPFKSQQSTPPFQGPAWRKPTTNQSAQSICELARYKKRLFAASRVSVLNTSLVEGHYLQLNLHRQYDPSRQTRQRASQRKSIQGTGTIQPAEPNFSWCTTASAIQAGRPGSELPSASPSKEPVRSSRQSLTLADAPPPVRSKPADSAASCPLVVNPKDRQTSDQSYTECRANFIVSSE